MAWMLAFIHERLSLSLSVSLSVSLHIDVQHYFSLRLTRIAVALASQP